jgi:hypothetical protein
MKQQNKWEKLFDEFLDLTEFTLVKHQNDWNRATDEYGHWSLVDNQGGNIGNIEGDRFTSVAQILDRMEIYIDDYIVSPLIDEFVDKDVDIEPPMDDWADLLRYYNSLPDSKWDFDVLDMICNHFEEINLENCTYEEEE